MAYIDKSTVRSATGMTNTTKIPDAYLDAKIAYADGAINGKIGEVYALPLASTPNLIKFFSLEITIATLFMDQFGEDAGDKDKGWQKRLDWIFSQLEMIRTGKMKLYDDTTGTELTRSTLKTMSFYPTESSSDPSSEDSTAPQIEMDKKW